MTVSRANVVALVACGTACVTAANAYKVELVAGTFHPLRHGNAEGAPDNIVAPYYLGTPVCVSKGSAFGLKLVPDPGEQVVRWQVTAAILTSTEPGSQPHWSNSDGPNEWHAPNATHMLPAVPGIVDIAGLQVAVNVEHESSFGESLGLPCRTARFIS
ncbi:MAG: hypothetical protein ACR2HJ_05450 [Fimbriimonadales bacterium]